MQFAANLFKLYLMAVSAQQTRAQITGVANDSELWRLSIDFLAAFDAQQPIKRLIAFFEDSAKNVPKSNEMLEVLRKACSERGIFLSAVKIPSPSASSFLQPDRPPVVCAFFLTSAAATAAFMKSTTDAQAAGAENTLWIHFSKGKKIPSDLSFLRADANFMLVQLDAPNKSAQIHRWNGVGLAKNVTAWKNGDKNIKPLAFSRPQISLLGFTLSVALFHDPPFVNLESLNGSSRQQPAEKASGWIVELWRQLETRLKFKSSFYQPTRRGGGGIFKLAVEELVSGRADVVLAPFAAVHGDLQLVDFTLPFTTFSYKFVVPRVTASSSLNQFLRPFSINLWMSIFATATLAVILMTTAYMLGQKFGFEQTGRPLYGFSESALILYGSLLAQGPDFSPSSFSARTILWTTFAFGVVICQAYAATLTSKLLLGIVEPPFKNLEGMLASPYAPIFVTDSAPHRLTLRAEAGLWKELRDRKPFPRTTSDLDSALTEISNSWSFTTFIDAYERILPNLQDPTHKCKFLVLPVEITKIPASFMLSKFSHFKQALDQQLMLMATSGQLSRLKTKWMGASAVEDSWCAPQSGLPRFEMENVALPFLVLAVAFLVGLLMLFVEFLIKKWLSDELQPLELLRQIVANNTLRSN